VNNKVIDFWNNILSGSTVQDHCHYKLTEIDNIPETPGMYAWYLNVDQNNFLDYYKVYKQKKVEVSIKGNFDESYIGELRNVYNEGNFKDNGVDHKLCFLASLAFSPPLYIGISNNLYIRLRQHCKELEKIYYNKIPLSKPTSLGKTDFDTILESMHFAQRIGHTIRLFKNINLNSLLIKTIEMPKGYSWSELHKVEKYLNRTYIPIYGRK
jgi:hypothetical protein